jgi:hypothetical protein
MTVENESVNDEKIWKKFFQKHFGLFLLFIIAGIIAFASAVYVFLWFVAEAQLTNLVPEILGEWTIGYCITFILHLIFWELIYIGIPVVIFIAAVYFLWWKKLPDDERKEYKEGNLFLGGKNHRRDAGGMITFLINIFFLIKVYIDDNWNLAFKDWKFDYLVNSYIWALIWVLVIFGIPILIGVSWWISQKLKK